MLVVKNWPNQGGADRSLIERQLAVLRGYFFDAALEDFEGRRRRRVSEEQS